MVIVALVTACTSGSSRAARAAWKAPADPIGSIAVPARPLVVRAPAGWTVRPLRAGGTPGEAYAVTSQFLFLPPGSSPTYGPAIAVGMVGDDEWGPADCLTERTQPTSTTSTTSTTSPVGGSGPATGRVGVTRRAAVGRGPERVADGISVVRLPDPDFLNDTSAFLLGRDVSDRALRRAASTFAWTGDGEVPVVDLPAGFRLVATGSLPAHGGPDARVEQVVDARRRQSISVGQEDGNDAAVAVAKFWKATVERQTCFGAMTPLVERTLVRGPTVVRLRGDDRPAVRRAMRAVERDLERAPVSPTGT